MYKFEHKTLCDFNLCIVRRNEDTRYDVFVNDDYLFTAFRDEFSISRFENFSLKDLNRIEKLDVSLYEICAVLTVINEDQMNIANHEFRETVSYYETFADCVNFILKIQPNFFNN